MIDDYTRSFPERVQVKLRRIRELIQQSAPEATEKFSYQIPTFYLHGNLVHFAAYKRHIGFYPTSSGISAFEDEILRYKHSRGAVQFLLDEPLSEDLIRRIVAFRVKENMGDGD
ncbi:MAG: DUF1801 domain-containing protein [Anaerolineales bacterium]